MWRKAAASEPAAEDPAGEDATSGRASRVSSVEQPQAADGRRRTRRGSRGSLADAGAQGPIIRRASRSSRASISEQSSQRRISKQALMRRLSKVNNIDSTLDALKERQVCVGVYVSVCVLFILLLSAVASIVLFLASFLVFGFSVFL